MTTPTVKNIWLEKFDNTPAIRVDFDNDRHHRMVIKKPWDQQQLASALYALADQIRLDPHLLPTTIDWLTKE